MKQLTVVQHKLNGLEGTVVELGVPSIEDGHFIPFPPPAGFVYVELRDGQRAQWNIENLTIVSLPEESLKPCPHCSGEGWVKE